MENLDYLGKGEAYPFKPDVNGGVELISDVLSIEQSIPDILETPLLTHFPIEIYGSNLYLLTFMQNDSILDSLLIYFISEALYLWEKRIRVTSVIPVRVNESRTDCHINYRVLASNEINAFVYPFYKEIKT